jgi:hypothetical protein
MLTVYSTDPPSSIHNQIEFSQKFFVMGLLFRQRRSLAALRSMSSINSRSFIDIFDFRS